MSNNEFIDTGVTLEEIRESIGRLSKKLSAKHKRFADEWLANGNNGTMAYLSVFDTKKPSAAAAGSSRLLKRGDVKAYIDLCKQYTTDEVLNHLTITKDRIFDEEAKLAFIDIRKMFGPDEEFIHPKYWPEELARAASGVDVDQKWDTVANKWKYKYKIRFNDKGRSLKRLQDCLGMTKAPELTTKDSDLIKDFLNSIDGDSRGKLPFEIEDGE